MHTADKNIALSFYKRETGFEGYFRPPSPLLTGTTEFFNLVDKPMIVESSDAQPSHVSSPSITVNCLSASWKNKLENVVLSDVSFKVDKVNHSLLSKK